MEGIYISISTVYRKAAALVDALFFVTKERPNVFNLDYFKILSL